MKISQVSRMLGLSPETIRYYEKEGLLSPARKSDSTHRTYSTWDFFALMDCIADRNMNFTVNETRQVTQKGDVTETLQLLSSKCDSLRREIEFRQLQLETVETIKHKLESARINTGNYWLQKKPTFQYIPFGRKHGNNYEILDQNNISPWFQAQPFVRGIFHIDPQSVGSEDDMLLSLSGSRKVIEFLDLPIDERVTAVPEKTYLHTMLDIGAKDNFSGDLLRDALQYTKDKQYIIDGDIICELFIRIRSQEEWHRYLEVMIPIAQI